MMRSIKRFWRCLTKPLGNQTGSVLVTVLLLVNLLLVLFFLAYGSYQRQARLALTTKERYQAKMMEQMVYANLEAKVAKGEQLSQSVVYFNHGQVNITVSEAKVHLKTQLKSGYTIVGDYSLEEK